VCAADARSVFDSLVLVYTSRRLVCSVEFRHKTAKQSLIYCIMRGCAVPSDTGSRTKTFKGTSGTIYSPNFPDNYYNRDRRVYLISAPSLSKIVLTFKEFELEYDDDCDYDSLKASISSIAFGGY